MLSQVRENTLIVQSYPQEDLKSNQELRNIVNHLISRVQHLEATKAEQSVTICTLKYLFFKLICTCNY
jgi:hypothetical protein